MKMHLSASILKWIAVFSMTIDHIGAFILGKYLSDFHVYQNLMSTAPDKFHLLYNLYHLSRTFGRIAFPIFCFLLVESFFHTKNLKQYAISLFVFGIISEGPFNLALSGDIIYYNSQNVFFTLLLGVGMMYTFQSIENIFYKISGIIIIFLVAYFGNPDYSYSGLILIAVLYFFRSNRLLQCLFGAVSVLWEWPAIFAFIPIYFYNGERGKQNKYFFYLYYPIHLFLFYICYSLII